MSVLDPFEVFEIEVWPLPQFQDSNRADMAARQHLDALERLITDPRRPRGAVQGDTQREGPTARCPRGGSAAVIPRADRVRAGPRVAIPPRFPHRAARIDHLAPGAGDLRAKGPGWTEAGAPHSGQAPAVAVSASVRSTGRRSVGPRRGRRGRSLSDSRTHAHKGPEQDGAKPAH